MSMALAEEIENDPDFVDKSEIDPDLFRFATAAESSWRRRKMESMDFVQTNFERYANKYHNIIFSPLTIPPDYLRLYQIYIKWCSPDFMWAGRGVRERECEALCWSWL